MNKFFASTFIVFCICSSGAFAVELGERHECEDIHYRSIPIDKQSQGLESAAFELMFEDGPRKYRLTTEGLPGHYFLEHRRGVLKTVTDPSWNRINRSGDDGVTWSPQTIIPGHPSGPGSINALFSTSLGGELVRATSNLQIWRHDLETGAWLNTGLSAVWLGSWSIADNGNGTLILAEYCSDSATVGRIFRSQNDGRSWVQVFSVRALGTTHPEGQEIRHFHTAGFVGGRSWVVSSGDTPAESRMWISEQDGDPGSWEEITDPVIEDSTLSQTLHRHTCWWMWDKWDNKYFAATDDRLAGSGSRWWLSQITKPFDLQVLGRVAYNDVRSAIGFPGLGRLLITENKKFQPGVDVTMVTETLQTIPVGMLVGVEGFFTSSVASDLAVGDVSRGGAVGYTLAKGLAQQTWRWKLEEVFVLQPGHDSFHGSIVIEPEKEYYQWGDVVTLTAIPYPPAKFQGWSRGTTPISTGPHLNVVIKDNLSSLFGAFGTEEDESFHKLSSMEVPWFVDGPEEERANK